SSISSCSSISSVIPSRSKGLWSTASTRILRSFTVFIVARSRIWRPDRNTCRRTPLISGVSFGRVLVAVIAVMLLMCPGTFALDLSQYAHTPWKVRDGFVKGAISSIAQTPDGYLWLGTEFGLLRFD